MTTSGEPLRIENEADETCPWSGQPIAADSLTLYQGAVVGFAEPALRDQFEAAVRQFEAALQVRRAETAQNSE